MIITPNENISVISKVTGREYKVYKFKIEGTKVISYFINNLGDFEWWGSSRFYEPIKNCNRCKCCCKCCKGE